MKDAALPTARQAGRSTRQLRKAPAARPPDASSLPERYIPTPAEGKVIGSLLKKAKEAAPLASARVDKKAECTRLAWDHPSQEIGAALWANALGCTDFRFAATILKQLAGFSTAGTDVREAELNDVLSLVRGLAPRDPTEALLVTQMVAIHAATMVASRRLTQAQTVEQTESASSALAKLARTFTLQTAALKNYRLKGEQTIRVQYVNVHEGGQAIVGNVQHAPGGHAKIGEPTP